MGFLIDTDIWVAVERGSLAPADIHAITGAEPIFLSPVNVAELQMGIDLVIGHRVNALSDQRFPPAE